MGLMGWSIGFWPRCNVWHAPDVEVNNEPEGGTDRESNDYRD